MKRVIESQTCQGGSDCFRNTTSALNLTVFFSFRELDAAGAELSGGNCRSWSENVYSKLFLDPGSSKLNFQNNDFRIANFQIQRFGFFADLSKNIKFYPFCQILSNFINFANFVKFCYFFSFVKSRQTTILISQITKLIFSNFC